MCIHFLVLNDLTSALYALKYSAPLRIQFETLNVIGNSKIFPKRFVVFILNIAVHRRVNM